MWSLIESLYNYYNRKLYKSGYIFEIMEEYEKPLVYPPVVIAHIVNNLKDYLNQKVQDKSSVDIHYSAQLNGHPHMGTLTSLATAFTIGEYIQREFDIPPIIKFEALENAPIEKNQIGDREYCKMHSYHYVDGVPLSEVHMTSFKEVLDYLKVNTGVNYEVEYYEQFQKNPFVRKTLLEIISREKEFIPYIAPSEGLLRIRFPCNECYVMEKTSKDSRIIENHAPDYVTYQSECPEHGEFEIRVSQDEDNLIDFNTSIRNVIKEARFIEEAKGSNAMNLMVDGGDWTGMAFQVMQSLGLLGYQISDLPVRIFTPIIEDWSGAKFSKSVYVKEGTYKHVPLEFLDYKKFKETFGIHGLETVLNESRKWIEDPKKLFRNYSVDYLRKVFNI